MSQAYKIASTNSSGRKHRDIARHGSKEPLTVIHVFLISNSILGVNIRIGKQIYVFKVKSCLGVA